MNVNFEARICDLQGQDIPWDEQRPTMVLRDVCLAALTRQVKGDEELTGEQKFKLWDIARRLNDKASILSVEEIALIKSRIGTMFTPLVIGPAWNLLEGKQ